MMKKITLLAIGLSLTAFNISADETLRNQIGIKVFNNEYIDDAMEIELKYQTDKGGYVYANYYKEKSSCEQSVQNLSCIDGVYHDVENYGDMYSVHNYKGKNIEFGIGVSEAWKNKSFNAEFYIGAGFYMNDGETYSEDYEIGNPIVISSTDKLEFENKGLAYHAGANLHPFSDNFTINLELSNTGDNSKTPDTFYGDVYSNENVLSYGVSYKYNNLTFKAEHADNDVSGFSVTADF